MTTLETIIQLAPLVLYLFSHGAAIFGKPELVAKIKPLSTVVDVLAANYGKAKNLD
jgi:hypothetical protein